MQRKSKTENKSTAVQQEENSKIIKLKHNCMKFYKPT